MYIGRVTISMYKLKVEFKQGLIRLLEKESIMEISNKLNIIRYTSCVIGLIFSLYLVQQVVFNFGHTPDLSGVNPQTPSMLSGIIDIFELVVVAALTFFASIGYNWERDRANSAEYSLYQIRRGDDFNKFFSGPLEDPEIYSLQQWIERNNNGTLYTNTHRKDQ